MAYEDRVSNEVSTVKFGGLNTRDNPIYMPEDHSPYSINVDPLPLGSARSRLGFARLSGIAGDSPGAIVYSPVEDIVPADAIAYLPKIASAEAFLICSRAGQLWQRKLAPSEVWTAGRFPVSAGAPINSAVGRFYDGTTFFGSSLFCANGQDEPFIVTGVASDVWWTLPYKSITRLVGTTLGAALIIEISAHGMKSGDVVMFTGISNITWSALNNIGFRVKVINSGSFNLLDSDLVTVKATGGDWPNVPTPDFASARTMLVGIKRWPKAVYSDTQADQVKGYLEDWDNPDAGVGGPWGTANATGWPAAIAISGSGLSMQAYAYGFAADPDRVDVSELGEPTHFGRTDMVVTDPVAEPGIDGWQFWCNRGDGDRVTGVIKMYAYTVVMKGKTTHLYVDDDQANLALSGSLSVGNAGPGSFGMVGGELFFWDMASGPKRLSSVQEYGDIAPGDLGDVIPVEIRSVTKGTENKIRFVHDRDNRCVRWFVCVDGSLVCNRVFVYFYTYDRWAVYDGPYAECSGVCASTGASGDGNALYASRLNGEIVNLGSGYMDGLDENDDGVPIRSTYRTKWLSWPGVSWTGRNIFADVMVGGLGLGDATIKIGHDFTDVPNILAEPELAIGSVGAGYDFAEYEVDDYGSSSPMLMRYNLEGQGNVHQIGIDSTSIYPWEIHAISLEIAVRGKRP